MFVHPSELAHIYIYIHVYMYVYLYVYLYVYCICRLWVYVKKQHGTYVLHEACCITACNVYMSSRALGDYRTPRISPALLRSRRKRQPVIFVSKMVRSSDAPMPPCERGIAFLQVSCEPDGVMGPFW